MNDTTFQGDGKVAYVPVVVNVKPPKQSNYDRLISKSPEELADWLSIYCCRNKTYDAHCETFGNCKACWLDWLREEATDGKQD